MNIAVVFQISSGDEALQLRGEKSRRAASADKESPPFKEDLTISHAPSYTFCVSARSISYD